jgi:hypothetical protein
MESKMYLIRENVQDEEITGYWIDEKINGKLIESHFVTKDLKTCSCKYFAESQNPYNHFHINLCSYWIKSGKPQCAMYAKSKKGKIVVLCPGFTKIK